MVIDGAVDFKIESDVRVYIDVDSLVTQFGGTIRDSGFVIITGDIVNKNTNPSANVFAPGLSGWVRLKGKQGVPLQSIRGTSPVRFNNLALDSSMGVKKLIGIDAFVDDSLRLDSLEFAADTNVLRVLGTGPGLITRNNSPASKGFVSATGNGGLARNTNSTLPYLFPVGSSTGTQRYRPVSLAPVNANLNTYKVRLANVDATSEAFPRNQRDTNICNINPNYYHRITRDSGTSAASITIYFPTTENYEAIAHWQNTPRWEPTGVNPLAPSPPFAGLTASAWNDFSYPAFALTSKPPAAVTLSYAQVCQGFNANFVAPSGFTQYDFYVNSTIAQTGTDSVYTSNTLTNGDKVTVVTYSSTDCRSYSSAITVSLISSTAVNAGNDTTVNIAEKVVLSASGNSGLTYSWSGPNSSLTTICSNCPNTPPVSQLTPGLYTYYLTGVNAQGCISNDTVVLKVEERYSIDIPNVFSPNGDGRNDELKAFGKGVDWFLLTIYDRWGEKVFELSDFNTGWKGDYNGQEMNTAVFVYILKGKYLNGKEIDQKGNFTLLK